MTTFQDLPPQSRRAVRQSERDGDASAAVSSAPLNLAQTFLPTPDGAPASPQAPPATGRRSRATPQSGLVDMPTSPPAGYTADPRNAEPLNYITQGAPGSSQPAPLAAPQPAAPQQTGEQPAFRVRDFSPEGRRAAPVSAPQPTAAPLDYRTQAAPVTPSAPAAAPAPGVHATGPVSPVATQPPVAAAPDSVAPDSAVPVSVAPVAAAPTAAPVAGAAAPVGPPLSRRELRAREAEALAASGAFSGVMPVPELVEPAPAPQANLSNAMAEFEALTRAAESDAENQPRDAAPQVAAQHATGEQASQRTGEQFVQQRATGEQAVAQQAQQDSGEQDSAEQAAPQHAEQAQAEQDQAEQQQSAQAAAATELEADHAQAEQAEQAQAEQQRASEEQAEQQRASDEQAAQHAADQHTADQHAAQQQAADEQAAQYAAQAEAAQQQAAQQHAAEQHAAEQAHAAEQQRARDAALAAQATAQAEANARAAADELQQSELLAERKREYEAAQAEAAQSQAAQSQAAQAAQPQAAFPAPAPANPFDALFTSPGTASPAAAQPFNVPFVEPDLEQTGSHATSTGHWSRQAALDDEFQPFENTLSRDVGGGNVATTTSALVLPIAPQDTDFGSVLNGTGEVLITGSIDLPRSLSATGGDARRYDDPDVDNLFDAFDNEIISTDSAPVRAIRAVSTHTSTHGVITSAKPKGNRLLIGAAIGAVVLAIVVVGLLIVVVQTMN